MSGQKYLYVFTSAPYTGSAGQEGLDAALIGAAFEADVSVLFLHDGVFQLKRGQDASQSMLKQTTKTFAALKDFGIENIYVHDLSLLARGLEPKGLIIEPQLVDSGAVQHLLQQQIRVFTF